MYIDGDGNSCDKYCEYLSSGLKISKGGHTQTIVIDMIVALWGLIFPGIQFGFYVLFVSLKLQVANITRAG